MAALAHSAERTDCAAAGGFWMVPIPEDGQRVRKARWGYPPAPRGCTDVLRKAPRAAPITATTTRRVLAILQLAAVVVPALLVLTGMVHGHTGRLPTAAPSSGPAKA